MAAPISASVIPDSEISRRAALISMPHCDTRPHQRQYAPVFAAPYPPSWRSRCMGRNGSYGPTSAARRRLHSPRLIVSSGSGSGSLSAKGS